MHRLDEKHCPGWLLVPSVVCQPSSMVMRRAGTPPSAKPLTPSMIPSGVTWLRYSAKFIKASQVHQPKRRKLWGTGFCSRKAKLAPGNFVAAANPRWIVSNGSTPATNSKAGFTSDACFASSSVSVAATLAWVEAGTEIPWDHGQNEDIGALFSLANRTKSVCVSAGIGSLMLPHSGVTHHNLQRAKANQACCVEASRAQAPNSTSCRERGVGAWRRSTNTPEFFNTGQWMKTRRNAFHQHHGTLVVENGNPPIFACDGSCHPSQSVRHVGLVRAKRKIVLPKLWSHDGQWMPITRTYINQQSNWLNSSNELEKKNEWQICKKASLRSPRSVEALVLWILMSAPCEQCGSAEMRTCAEPRDLYGLAICKVWCGVGQLLYKIT